MRQLTARIKRSGQALVETALLIMLLFFLVSAAFDLGMIFFAYQGIANAALEGASFGSIFPRDVNDGVQHIRMRVRNEPGIMRQDDDDARIDNTVAFANLLDLNSDGFEDGEAVVNNYIGVAFRMNWHGEQVDQDPNITIDCPTNRMMELCDIYVTVRFDYEPLFVLAPLMGDTWQLQATRSMTIRDRGSASGP